MYKIMQGRYIHVLIRYGVASIHPHASLINSLSSTAFSPCQILPYNAFCIASSRRSSGLGSSLLHVRDRLRMNECLLLSPNADSKMH